jgi:hypothetical protein
MIAKKPFGALLVVLSLLAIGAAFLANDNSGERMTAAAKAYLDGLGDAEKGVAVMEFDDARRMDWHFIPKDERKGLKVGEMSAGTRERAMELLKAALSETGYGKARTIMSLEAILHELENTRGGTMIRDPLRYYFTIFGSPGGSDPWGLSVEGHHLSLNFVVEDGKVTSHTPAFWGANPAEIKNPVATRLQKGYRTLAAEESLAFDLVNSLTSTQRATAIIDETAPRDIRGPADVSPPAPEQRGLSVAEFTEEQKKTLWKLLEAFAANMPTEVGREDLAAIEQAGVEKIYFAWAGATEPGIGHYYCVEGPTFLLEFCNVQPDSAGNPANHIHSVWRSTSGDFGLHR